MQVTFIEEKKSFRISGRRQMKKSACVRALPKSPKPPPNLGNLVLFFRTSKTTVCTYDQIFFKDDNDGCNDNYGNFDDDYDKND